MTGPIVGTGTDSGGQAYEVRQFSATHTYAMAGSFTAYFDACCRTNGLVNGAGLNYRVESKVMLQPGNTSGPVSASPPLVQLQLGGTRTYTWPVIDPDGDPVTCRHGTAAETGFPNPIPSVPLGNAQPTLTTQPNACQLQWDVSQAVASQRYVLHVVYESTHNGQISSMALDLIVEIVTPPPPTCTGGGIFVKDVGSNVITMLTAQHNLATNLTVTSIDQTRRCDAAAGRACSRTRSRGRRRSADAGKTFIVLINYTNVTNLTGTCFVTVQVPQCLNYGAPCTAGIGECQKAGTNVCAGPGLTGGHRVQACPPARRAATKEKTREGPAKNGNPGGNGPVPRVPRGWAGGGDRPAGAISSALRT